MFTPKEEKILKQLQQNPGEIKFFEDIAMHFITKSQLEISTYSQLAYVNLSAAQSNAENVTNALSEYFEVLVFIKKLEHAEVVFHIPYTALENNTVKIGPEPENGVHKTIADADLLIQIFQYASKKYVFLPALDINEEVKLNRNPEKTDFFRIALLFLLILLIGFVGYHAHLERENLKTDQTNISQQIHGNKQTILQLEGQLRTNHKSVYSQFQEFEGRSRELVSNIDKLQNRFSDVRSSQQSQYYYLKVINSKVDSLIQNQ